MGDVKNLYLAWVSYLAFPNEMDRQQYGRLLDSLASTFFTYTIPLDENRLTDGIDLRYRFCYEYNLPNEIMNDIFDIHRCSILEMMVALALRCDEHIMFDSDFGNRANQWFFEMLKSLNLSGFTNSFFNEQVYIQIINRFLNRQYEPNGRGGLFTLRNPKQDMRNVEIWYQMSWFFAENFKDI